MSFKMTSEKLPSNTGSVVTTHFKTIKIWTSYSLIISVWKVNTVCTGTSLQFSSVCVLITFCPLVLLTLLLFQLWTIMANYSLVCVWCENDECRPSTVAATWSPAAHDSRQSQCFWWRYKLCSAWRRNTTAHIASSCCIQDLYNVQNSHSDFSPQIIIRSYDTFFQPKSNRGILNVFLL